MAFRKKYVDFLTSYVPGLAARYYRGKAEIAKARALEANYVSAQRAYQRGGPTAYTKKSEDGTLATDLWDLIERSREEWRNNSLYSGIIRRAVNNIGTARVIPKSTNADFNEAVQTEFEEWSSPDGGFAVQRMGLDMAQRNVLFGTIREGNVLSYEADEGWQFFEGIQIGTPAHYDVNGKVIRNGIELDGSGRPARYWISDFTRYGYLDPAKALGLRADRCVLLGNPEFFSGLRAVPPLANALPRFEDLDGYLEAELFGARVGTAVVGEINSNSRNAMSAFRSLLDKSKDNLPDPNKRFRMEPGRLLQTYEGETFKLHSPNRPAAAFPAFVRVLFRLLGMPIGMPLELAFMDFSETNFSAAKMMLLQAMKDVEVWRNLVVGGPLVRRVYLQWFQKHRQVRYPKNMDYADARRFELQWPANRWIDELKTAQSRLVGLKGGWETVSNVSREMNREVQDVLMERVKDFALAWRIVDENKDIPEDKKDGARAYVLSQIGEFKDLLAWTAEGDQAKTAGS